jgi:hypothetical protein
MFGALKNKKYYAFRHWYLFTKKNSLIDLMDEEERKRMLNMVIKLFNKSEAYRK